METDKPTLTRCADCRHSVRRSAAEPVGRCQIPVPCWANVPTHTPDREVLLTNLKFCAAFKALGLTDSESKAMLRKKVRYLESVIEKLSAEIKRLRDVTP